MLGFLRIQAIAVALGATVAADALLLSLTVLTLFDVVFVSGAAILTSQAMYARRHERRSERTAIAGLARSAAMWSWLALLFGVVCALAAEPLAAVIAPGFSPEARSIFAVNCSIAALLPAASSLMAFASALNRMNGREVLFTVNPLGINGLSWLALIVASANGAGPGGIMRTFLLTVLLSTLMMLGWQLVSMDRDQRRRLKAHFFRALLPSALLRKLRQHRNELRLVSPIVGALLIQQMVTLISYSYATRAGSGVLLLFGLAERLTNVIFAVCIMTFLTVLEPRWARAAVNPDKSHEVASDITVICVTLITLTATLMFAGDSLASVLFDHGALNASDLAQLADITRIYALSLPGLSLGVVLARLLVIHNRGDRIFLVNMLVTLLHLVLCIVCFELWEARGVAAALSLTFALQAAAYGWQLSAAAVFEPRETTRQVLRLCALAALAIGSAWLAAQIPLSTLARVLVVTLAALIGTVGGALVLGLRLSESLKRLARI